MQRLVPSLAALVLLAIGAHGLSRPGPVDRGVLTDAQREQIVRRLQQGEALGFRRMLRQLDGPGVLSLELYDRTGHKLAQWPPAPTRTSAGVFAGPLRAAQSGVRELVGQRDIDILTGPGGRLGELVSYRLPSVAGAHPGDLLLCALALWSLALIWRQPSTRQNQFGSPRPVLRSEQGTFRRLALRLGDAFDQLPAGVMLLDEGQRVRYLNSTAEQLSGWSRDQALNRPVYSVLRIGDSDPVQGNPLSFEGQPALSQELRVTLQARSGQRQDLDLTVIRLRRRDGNWAGMLILFRRPAGSAAQLEGLQREAHLADAMLDALGDGVALCDRYGRIMRVNRRLNRMFAYRDDELVGLTVAKLLPVPFLNEPSIRLEDYLGSRTEGRPRVVGWRKNATTFPVELQVHELDDSEYHYLLVLQDSGERLQRDKMSTRLGRLLDYAAEEIYIFDAHSLYFTEANRQAQDNLGYSMEQLARMTPLHLAPGLDREQFDRDLSALRNGETRQVAYRTEQLRANGTRYPASLRISYSPEEEPPVFMALAQDITDQRATEQRLETLAHTDELTRLPNRARLILHLDQLLRDAAGQPEAMPVWVGFLDLDRFKLINDSHGHATGDEVLREIARRIQACLSEQYFLARLSGDEFVICAAGVDAGLLIGTAERLLKLMREPIETASGQLDVGLCIGLARQHPGESRVSLMQRADAAMYAAKAQGGQRYVFADGDEAQAKAG